jgi:olefin beta-lactone synthetase
MTHSFKSLYPFRSNYITVDGFQKHYVDEGKGDTILMLHGNPTWSFYYRNLIQDLQRNFRVIAPDFIGCGLSDHPHNIHFRARDRVQHIQKLVDSLGIQSLSLVLHDWGGPIGTAFALNNLEKIRSIVYLNTTLNEVDSLPKFIKASASKSIGKFITKTTLNFLKLTTEFGVVRKLPKEVKRGYYYPYLTSARRTAIWDFVSDIPFSNDHPTYEDLVKIGTGVKELKSIPIKIVWGLKDPCFHKNILAKLTSYFSHAEVCEIADASHLVLEDAPDKVISEIRVFFEKKLQGYHESSIVHGDTNAVNCTNTLLEVKEKHAFSPTGKQDQVGFYDRFLALADFSPQLEAFIDVYTRAAKPYYSATTYGDIKKLCNQYQRGVAELGIKQGDRVLFLFPVSKEFLALCLAVMGRGAIPIFVDPGIGLENLKKCIKQAKCDVLIAASKGMVLKYLWRRTFKKIRIVISIDDYVLGADAKLSFLKKYSTVDVSKVETSDKNIDSTCFVAFTSGATGIPKGVQFTHAMCSRQLELFEQELGLTPQTKNFPLLHLFSLFNIALGVTTVLPPIDTSNPLSLDPKLLCTILQDQKIHSSFGSPTLWDKISTYCIRNGIVFDSLKRVFIAGAPVTEKVLKKVESIISHDKGIVYTPYGSTECLPVTIISSHDIKMKTPVSADTGEEGINVGKAAYQTKVLVIEPQEGQLQSFKEVTILKPGTIGEIIVSGAQVSTQYLENEEANNLSKICDESSTIWHRMGDMGYLDEDGTLYFCGRKAHRVFTTERVYYSIPIERIFNSHERVRRSALVGINEAMIPTSEILVQRPAIVIEPHSQFFPTTTSEKEKFTNDLKKLAASHALTANIDVFFFRISFPVDTRHNAKIYRDKLADWAMQELKRNQHA